MQHLEEHLHHTHVQRESTARVPFFVMCFGLSLVISPKLSAPCVASCPPAPSTMIEAAQLLQTSLFLVFSKFQGVEEGRAVGRLFLPKWWMVPQRTTKNRRIEQSSDQMTG